MGTLALTPTTKIIIHLSSVGAGLISRCVTFDPNCCNNMKLLAALCSSVFFLVGLSGVRASSNSRTLSALMRESWAYQIVDGVHPEASVVATFNDSIKETG